MGDPECQTILPLLKNDFIEVLNNCLNGTLEKINLEWKNEKSICVVLTSKGYPEKFEKNILIQNLENLEIKKNEYIYHAGTKSVKNKFYSTGGRVLNFVSLDRSFKVARDKALYLIKTLNWKNGYHRNDIAFKVIDNL